MATRIRTIATDTRGYFTDVGIRTAPPREKPYRLSEPSGLCLLIQPSGTRSWQYRHRFLHETTQLWTETIVSLGSYPNVGLREARAAVESAKTKVASGNMDDLRRRRRFKGEPAVGEGWLFRAIGEAWMQTAARETNWSDKTTYQVGLRWNKYVEPVLGSRDIRTVTLDDVHAMLAPVIASDNGTVLKRVARIVRDVFDYAAKRKLIELNPVMGVDLEAGGNKGEVEHHASLNRPAEVAVFLRAIASYRSESFRRGLLLLAHIFVRPGELQNARWEDVDFATARWTIPGDKMKKRRDHIVPLSRQALAHLRELRTLANGHEFVLPSLTKAGEPISDNTFRKALIAVGYGPGKFVPHGFRSMAMTMLDEQLRYSPNWINAQLAHKVNDPLGRAYNRSTYLHDRQEMMQVWSDYLDKLVAVQTE